MRSVLSVLLVVLVGSGCSGTLDPQPIAGRWGLDLSQVESSWEMDLTAHGSVIVGTGTWYGEACCSGTLAVTGSIKGRAVHLDINQTSTLQGHGIEGVSHFDGVLVSPFILEGTIVRDGSNTPPSPITYQRLNT